MAGKVDMKVVLLGKEFGGKTSLVHRYIHQKFTGDKSAYQNTIGAAFGAKRIEVDGNSIMMGIWDTAGSERYEAMSRIYYRGASAAIVCYDLTDATSFEKVKFWVKELKVNEPLCKVYLCGTKKDLVDTGAPRARDRHDVQDYADEIHAKAVETSAKTGHSIVELFDTIARDFSKLCESKQRQPSSALGGGIQLTDPASPSSESRTEKSKCFSQKC